MKQHLERLERLQSLLKEANLDLLVIEDPIDLYYMTGLQLSAGKLLVDLLGATLFVDGRYSEMCRKKSPFPVLPTDNASLIKWFEMPENRHLAVMGFDPAKTTYKRFLEWTELLHKISKDLPVRSIKRTQAIDRAVSRLREVKGRNEIDCLRKAAQLGSKGFDFVCGLLKEGITELEVASELEIFWKRNGGQALAFDSIIAFGENSSMPHYRPGHVALTQGSPVLIDIGVKLLNYHSDMTRTVFFGPPPLKMVQIYEIVKEAQQRALDLCRPGRAIKELDKAAREYIISEGYGEFFSHNLGHGVGLEIHEAPSLSQTSVDAERLLDEAVATPVHNLLGFSIEAVSARKKNLD